MAKSEKTLKALALEAVVEVIRTAPAVASILAIGWAGTWWKVDVLLGALAELLLAATDAKQVSFTGHLWAIPAFAAGALFAPLLVALVRRERGVPMSAPEPPEDTA